MSLPQVERVLPELSQFVAQLEAQYQRGSIAGWQAFGQQVRDFFTPEAMDRVERFVPGWRQMASHAEQQTLIHVTSVLVALRLLPEYQAAASEQQRLMAWMVLFHDLAKIPKPGQHDYVHGFRSAALSGKGLAQAGFPVTAAYPGLIDAWVTLTYTAVVFRDDLQEDMQDNRKLPAIMSGIDRLFGAQAPAGLIVKGALLHLSVATDPEYPTVAPLTDNEIQQYLDADFCPLLKMMMLVDADGWNLFDPATRQRHRQLTLAVYDHIGRLIGL